MNLLEFEKPIAELESKLADMKQLSDDSDENVTKAIQALDNKITELKKETFENLTGWQRVQLSRHPDRPYTQDYIYEITTDFIELHGDRNVGDDKAMIGGLGTIEGQTFMIIGQQKGRNTKQRQMRNFGMAFPGLEAEERGQGEAIARNLKEMFMLKVPVICIIIGEGASGGALGIAIGDRVLMLENTWYSVISPESCSSILWRSWDYKEQAAEVLKLTAKDMLKNKLIDGIVKEPLGGAHTDVKAMATEIKRIIIENYKDLSKLSEQERVNQRIDKFCAMGVVKE